MANPIYEQMYGGQTQSSFLNPTPADRYSGLVQRANQIAQNLPANFNPQMIAQQMVANGQITQQQLQQAMQIANQITGRC